MRRKYLAAATAIVLAAFQWAFPATAASPSFSCNGRLLPTEAVICSDDGLASFDRQLAAVYDSKLKSLPGGIRAWARMAQLATLQSSEKAWLAERNSCGANKSCISNAYQVRIS